MPLPTYQKRLSHFTAESKQLQQKLSQLSAIRLTSFLASIGLLYCFFKFDLSILLLGFFILFGLFLYLVRRYDQQKRKLDISKAHIKINDTEIAILTGLPSPYENGEQYIDTHHPYSYDLDLLGKGSLFHYLNRTTTHSGNLNLAKSLLIVRKEQIAEKQNAIAELVSKIDFRQEIQASGLIHQQEEKKIDALKKWLKKGPVFPNRNYYYFLCIAPALTLISLGAYIFVGSDLLKSITGLLFVVNLGIAFSFIKTIMQTLSVSSDISKTLQQFAEQLRTIENAQFTSVYLKHLQSSLQSKKRKTSEAIEKLSSLFNYLDIVFNVFVSPLLNGFSLFHVHVLYQMDQWKKDHGAQVEKCIEVIGEMEALNSLANLHFNNPDFTIPTMSESEDLAANELGHPLIKSDRRINNSISFLEKRFVILTGSNMSGKSTFLRTLGINLVLARAGAAVCAHSFRFYPYDVFVSMRISDSLQDSESLFYAELKRLHSIIEHIGKGNKTFILLDEILRGTNSNDKHNGTVGLIRKLVAGKAIGIIATHDLTVGSLTSEYSHYLDNKCFESEIINGELIFDYRIKQGVCSKLSASFLMKKMGIIE